VNRKAISCALFLSSAFLAADSVSAQDGMSAVSIAVGGLAPSRETPVAIAKEVLCICDGVAADYDFRNDTEQNVTAEVGISLPPYELGDHWDAVELGRHSFEDIRSWVDGKPLDIHTEAKAFLKDKDITGILEADHFDVPSFGHMEKVSEGAGMPPDYSRLPPAEKQRLRDAGILHETGYGFYTVHLQYHWTQTFPAHSTVHIRQEYGLAPGYVAELLPAAVRDALRDSLTPSSAARGMYTSDEQAQVETIAGFCADRPVLTALMSQFRRREDFQAKSLYEYEVPAREKETVGLQWVDFTLTSANAWRRPIGDFTLIVERPQAERDRRTLISFCAPANGKIEKGDASHFQVHLTNFVPTSELHIGFFDLPIAKPARPVAKR
jgi:hypothetical protein